MAEPTDPVVTLLAAVLGGAISGVASFFAVREQGKHSLTEQKKQWEHEQKRLQEQREIDRDREYEQRQREAIRELELVIPSFSRAARALYEARQERYAAAKEGKKIPAGRPDLETFVAQFNDLRYVAMACITKVGDAKLRRRAGHLYQLDESMALSDPVVWELPRETYGGHEPILVQVNWQEQLLSMSGRVYRGESIDDFFVEEHMHNPDLRRSAAPEATQEGTPPA
jgi:hypothetical protein